MKEYGKRPYYSANGEKAYPTFIKTKFAKALWDRITSGFPELAQFARSQISYSSLGSSARAALRFIRQSELKKPYQDPKGDYEEMEAEWEGLPGLRYPDPNYGPDQPWNLGEEPGFEGGAGIGDCVFDFNCQESDKEDCGYCPGSTTEFNVSGTYPITSLHLGGTKDSSTVISSASGLGTNNVTVRIYAGTDEWGQLRLWGIMDCNGIPGESNINLYEKESDDCPWFYMTLERGDGTDVDESLLVDFDIRGLDTGSYYDFHQEYLGGGEWLLKLKGPTYDPSNKYWIRYAVQSGDTGTYYNFINQYPGKHYLADFFQPADAIEPGVYSDDEVAYYDYTIAWNNTSFGIIPSGANNNCGMNGNDYWTSPGGTINLLHTESGHPVRWEAEVKSSIPYEIRMYDQTGTGQTRSTNAYGIYPCPCYSCSTLCGISGASYSGACGSGGPWYMRNGTLTETASDGITVSIHSPMGNTLPRFNQYADIAEGETTEPNPAGNTHFFQYAFTEIGPFTLFCDSDPDPEELDCTPFNYTFNNWAGVWGNSGQYYNSVRIRFNINVLTAFGQMVTV